jgi:hypothetical protein
VQAPAAGPHLEATTEEILEERGGIGHRPRQEDVGSAVDVEAVQREDEPEAAGLQVLIEDRIRRHAWVSESVSRHGIVQTVFVEYQGHSGVWRASSIYARVG